MISVLILTGEANPDQWHVNRLKYTFSDPYFDVKQIVVDTHALQSPSSLTYSPSLLTLSPSSPSFPSSLPSPSPSVQSFTQSPKNLKGSKSSREWEEIYTINAALKYGLQTSQSTQNFQSTQNTQATQNSILLIRDSSLCYLEPQSMKYAIQSAETIVNQNKKSPTFVYLCRWNDVCQKLKDVENVQDNGWKLKWSTNPQGSQAILFPREAAIKVQARLDQYLTQDKTFSMIIASMINNHEISAIAFSPSIVHYDTNLAISEDDFAKVNECNTEQMTRSTSTVSSNLSSYLWLALLIILIIFLAIAIIKYGKQ